MLPDSINFCHRLILCKLAKYILSSRSKLFKLGFGSIARSKYTRLHNIYIHMT